MKQKIIFSLLVIFFIGCSSPNSSLESEYFRVFLSNSVGTDSNPLIISPVNTPALASSTKYSDKSLSFSIKPSSTKIVSYSILSVLGSTKSGLTMDNFVYDSSTKKIGVRQGSSFGPDWIDGLSEMVTVTIKAQKDDEEFSDISVKVLLKATK